MFGVWTYLQQHNRPEADRLRPYIVPFIAHAPVQLWLPDDMVELVERFDFRECLAALREDFDKIVT